MYLEINGWETNIRFSACHFIPRHDKCGRLHGHIYAISARIHGGQQENGMVFDFIDLKRAMREIADDLDHRVLLPGNSSIVSLDLGETSIDVDVEGKHYSFPVEDCAVLDVSVCSAEELAKFVLGVLTEKVDLAPNINSLEIGVDEGRGQGAWVKREI